MSVATIEQDLEQLPLLKVCDLSQRWNPFDLYDKGQLISIEIGCGKGRFISQIALRNRACLYLGLELIYDRAKRSALKCLRAGVDNACVINGSMEELFSKLSPAILFDQIFINFPDPWPKKRHASRRLIEDQKIKTYHQFLKPGGRVVFVTDDPFYAYEGATLFKAQGFIDVFGGFRCHWPTYPMTIHEEKFRKQGREIYFQQFAKASKE